MSRDDKIIGEVGGSVDEFRLTLGVYGPDLDPAEVTMTLGCSPTSAHRRGDPRPRSVPPWPQGAWLLTVEGRPPKETEHLVMQLLEPLSRDPEIWNQLNSKYTVQLRFGIFVNTWNRGFDLSAASIRLINITGARVGFDIYVDPPDE